MHQQNIIYFNEPLYRGTNDPFDYKRDIPIYFLYGNNGENLARRLYTSTKRPNTNVFMYLPLKPLKLLDMSRAKSIQFLREKYNNNEHILNAIDKTFILQNQYTAVIRHSKKQLDYIVARAVCDAGFDGYYSPKLRKVKSENPMHQEIALCDAENKIKGINLNRHLQRPSKKRKIIDDNQTYVIPNKKVMKRIRLNF